MQNEYRIHRLGYQGDGIAEGPLFAARTLPGEVVTGLVNGTTLNDVRIVTPSEDRVQPVCRHYKACGGCQLQHASDRFVANWKQEIVQSALASHGLETEFRPIITSPAQSRRRATFAVRRTKKGAMSGFHGRASDVIVDIPDCQLLDPAVLQSRPVIEALALIGGSRKGGLDATVTATRNGADIAVTGGKPLDGALRAELGAQAEAHRLSRLTWDGETVGIREPAVQSFGRGEVVPPPGAFLQATRQGEAALLECVREMTRGAARVADLFAGCGTFSLPMAETAEVHAVEGESEMIAAMDRGWREAQGLKRLTSETRDLFRRPMLPDELARFDAIVIDPPRAGAAAQVEEIATAKRPVVAFVSCNPVTFARDAAVLVAAGYRLDWIQVVDQFRWSVHTELAASFSLH